MLYKDYTLDDYYQQIDRLGLDKTWSDILDAKMSGAEASDLLNISNFGELYELGLVQADKQSKKELGKYYTPHDVGALMAKWLLPLKGNYICDVCCGTGNLILAVLEQMPRATVETLLDAGGLYLYDMDTTALKICQYSIAMLYGEKYLNKINVRIGDFLDADCVLPENVKCIANPPYFKIQKMSETWDITAVTKDCKELYASIFEKIVEQSESSVIITPYSFMNGKKFAPLRTVLADHGGFIVAFDNVPGSIFCGRKHGVFNTNTSNSVRAAITVTDSDSRGYRVSPLIRFKNEQRKELLNPSVLESTLSNVPVMCGSSELGYRKCFKSCAGIADTWVLQSKRVLGDVLCKQETPYALCVPNSCRYFTVGTIRDLSRTGKYTLHFQTEEDRDLAYGFINSSFAYMYWRMYAGGITYPLGLLQTIPIFFDSIDTETKKCILNLVHAMQDREEQFLSYKKNASVMQETVKFPEECRKQLNQLFCKALNQDASKLDVFHSNTFEPEETQYLLEHVGDYDFLTLNL